MPITNGVGWGSELVAFVSWADVDGVGINVMCGDKLVATADLTAEKARKLGAKLIALASEFEDTEKAIQFQMERDVPNESF